MPGRSGWSEIRRPLAALGIVCLLMAGCNAADREPMAADPPPPIPTPGSSGALAYGVDGDIYVAHWDGSNAVRIADGRPPTTAAAWASIGERDRSGHRTGGTSPTGMRTAKVRGASGGRS